MTKIDEARIPIGGKPSVSPLEPTVVYLRDTKGRRRRALIRLTILLLVIFGAACLAYIKRSTLAKTLADLLGQNSLTLEQRKKAQAQAILDAMRDELTREQFADEHLNKVKALFDQISTNGPYYAQAEVLWKRGQCKALSQKAKPFEDKEEWAKATELLAQALQFDRSDQDIQRRLKASQYLAKTKEYIAEAEDFLKKGEREKALSCFEMAIEVAKQTSHPKATEYRNQAARLLEQIKLHEHRLLRERQADELFRKGDFEAEAAILAELARTFENDFQSKAKYAELLSRGLAALQRKEMNLAESLLSQIPPSDRHHKKAQEVLTEIKKKKYFDTRFAQAEKLLLEAKPAEAIAVLKEIQPLQPDNETVAELLQEAELLQSALSEAQNLRRQGKHYQAMQKYVSIKKQFEHNNGVVALCDSEIKTSQSALLDLMRKASEAGSLAWQKYQQMKTQVDERDLYRLEGAWDAYTRLTATLCEAYNNLNTARNICAELKIASPKDEDYKAATAEILALTKKLFAIAYQHEHVIRNREIARTYYRAVVQLPCVEDDEYWKLADQKLKAAAQEQEQPNPK